jgi:hypothetical protein
MEQKRKVSRAMNNDNSSIPGHEKNLFVKGAG